MTFPFLVRAPFALLVLVLCAGPEPVVARSKPVLCDLPSQTEDQCRSQLGGRAIRKGETLTLKTARGTVRLTDRGQDDPRGEVIYVLTGLRDGYFIVREVWFGEEQRGLLISAKSGARLELISPPTFSPSGQTFFVTQNFAFGTPDQPYLEIFERRDTGFVRVFTLPDYPVPGLLWDRIGWDGDTAIEFEPPSEPDAPRKLRIMRTGARWEVIRPDL